MMDGFVMMGLCGENSNNSGSSSHVNINNSNNNINGVFCPMMLVTSSAAHTTNSSYPLQLPPTTTTGSDDIRRLTGSRGVFYMNSDISGTGSPGSSARAKIMAHPLYPRLIAAYASCQKVSLTSLSLSLSMLHLGNPKFVVYYNYS